MLANNLTLLPREDRLNIKMADSKMYKYRQEISQVRRCFIFLPVVVSSGSSILFRPGLPAERG